LGLGAGLAGGFLVTFEQGDRGFASKIPHLDAAIDANDAHDGGLYLFAFRGLEAARKNCLEGSHVLVKE
jgi:hypothetical protein